jgi:hypothetical protein
MANIIIGIGVGLLLTVVAVECFLRWMFKNLPSEEVD